MELPTLYKKSSKGATQEWRISVEPKMQGAVIVTVWGQQGGALQEARDFIAEGKNVGKKNETSPSQQAELEATSQWEKKLKKGYVKSQEGAEAGEVDAIITGGVTPMLAHRFDQHGAKLSYPCYVQPKLDGHRCLAVVDAVGKCTLWSRTRKPITSMGHIVAAVEELGFSGVVLDGELYVHSYKNRFEELTSFIRDSSVKPGSDVVQYHVYDIAGKGDFRDRTMTLENMIGDIRGEKYLPLVCVETARISSEDDLMLAFERHLVEGYEGSIARNAMGLYVNKRSFDLLKLKEMIDGDYIVVGVEEGRGKLAGHAIFVCKTADGQEFRAKLVGEQEGLKKYWSNPSLAVGRLLTVKYQGLTSAGIPRFPVALRFREDI